jgi:uncharacterized protein
MSNLPEIISKAWDEKEGPVVFTTVNSKGEPNAIYATCVGKYDESTIVIADNYFDKTRKNIDNGSRGSVLFITEEGKSFQLKGTIGYHTEGPLFTNMKEWNPEKHPGHAAVALTVEEAYSGAEKLL